MSQTVQFRFYEEFAQNSAVRRKLRATRTLHLGKELSTLHQDDFLCLSGVQWESVNQPWPEVSEHRFAGSVGHVLNQRQKEKFLSSLQWTEFYDFNAPVESFDFSLLASRPRHFNSLQFQESSVTKICSWKEKGLAEVGFFKSVPEILKTYYPQVLSSTLTEKNFVYSMTHLRRFDLGRIRIEADLSRADWDLFFSRLGEYFSLLPQQEIEIDQRRERLRKLFIYKLLDRYEALKQVPDCRALLARFQRETGANFEDRIQSLVSRLEENIAKSRKTNLVFSHGDLSFCNILYDLETGDLAFVDPRGKDPVEGCDQPVEYDLAKLSHSVLGDYELIVMGAVDVQPSQALKESFLEFLKPFQISTMALRNYEASLFWSLLPLHLEDSSQLLQLMLAGERAFQAGTEG